MYKTSRQDKLLQESHFLFADMLVQLRIGADLTLQPTSPIAHHASSDGSVRISAPPFNFYIDIAPPRVELVYEGSRFAPMTLVCDAEEDGLSNGIEMTRNAPKEEVAKIIAYFLSVIPGLNLDYLFLKAPNPIREALAAVLAAVGLDADRKPLAVSRDKTKSQARIDIDAGALQIKQNHNREIASRKPDHILRISHPERGDIEIAWTCTDLSNAKTSPKTAVRAYMRPHLSLSEIGVDLMNLAEILPSIVKGSAPSKIMKTGVLVAIRRDRKRDSKTCSVVLKSNNSTDEFHLESEHFPLEEFQVQDIVAYVGFSRNLFALKPAWLPPQQSKVSREKIG